MRQFIAPSEPDPRGRITVTGKDFRYLRNVLRLQPDDTLDVRLSGGELCRMRVAEVKAAGSALVLERCGARSEGARATAETGVPAGAIEGADGGVRAPLWLFQFMPKAQKMDLIVRQAAETGVAVIVPVRGARSQKSDCIERRERWQRIVREARQQSGSPVETTVAEPLDLDGALRLWSGRCGARPCAVALYEESAGCLPLHSCAARMCASGTSEKPTAPCTAAALAVGCEGGLSPDEIDVLQRAGFAPVHFDTNILRTETAALYGIAALQTILTEYTSWRQSGFPC
ncbi:RsmE family RNA methyltransferase [Treponema brennaborense]|uniref:Ribosomal RNA small subunit methyltransferase E n=1 Tax=Treponema brennaborense (strain DSM 12168 / CIP 105900 / DD5/3) TaxID=906968 RepID=F4LLL8_TREBD|nr:RsmE family RNA methyltransferase [Treponema brennaborense]AEE17662.1 Ribosomal RNA small subunit methyltransferase E [Treponema brennaborense DSM 12168]